MPSRNGSTAAIRWPSVVSSEHGWRSRTDNDSKGRLRRRVYFDENACFDAYARMSLNKKNCNGHRHDTQVQSCHGFK